MFTNNFINQSKALMQHDFPHSEVHMKPAAELPFMPLQFYCAHYLKLMQLLNYFRIAVTEHYATTQLAVNIYVST